MQFLNPLALTAEMVSAHMALLCSPSLGKVPHLGLYLCRFSPPPSALALTATEPGSASRSAEVRKNLKYEGLCDRYIFQAIAIETSCVFGRDTNAFISRLGHLTTSISGERREAEFLRQRLSLATVRGNAQSVTQAGRPSS